MPKSEDKCRKVTRRQPSKGVREGRPHLIPPKPSMRTLHDEQRERQLIKQVFELAERRIEDLHELLKYQYFYDHIKAHFEKGHPDWEVKCKICGKTFKEITHEFEK